MPVLQPEVAQWVLDVVDPGTSIDDVRGLREGGSPWLVRLVDGDGARSVVVRVGNRADLSGLRTEIAGLRVAADHGITVPAVIAAELAADPPLVLTEAVAGRSTIPRHRPVSRLRRLGALAASVHAVPAPGDPDLPVRDRPIQTVDFAALRASAPHSDLLVRGERVMAAYRPDGPHGFVHGDLWQGNVLWDGDALTAVLDWDCAGTGPAGVDLGSLRCDAAVCFGIAAAADVLAGWQDEAGRQAADVAYWDVVAALSTPPDMGWFPTAIADQGRTDLTQRVLLDRRDAFLAAAIDRLDRP